MVIFAPVFIWYGPGPSGMSFWHSGNLHGCVLLLYYVSYLLFLGVGLLVSGGVGVPFSGF